MNFTVSQQNSANISTLNYNHTLPNNAVVLVSLSLVNTTTSIPFANQTVTLNPNTLKLTISVSNWTFSSIQNNLQLILNVSPQSSSKLSDSCQITTSQTDSQGVLAGFQTSINGATFFGEFLSVGEVDSRVRPLAISFVQNGTNALTSITSPFFQKSLVVDPNYLILLDPTRGVCNPSDGGNDLSGSEKIKLIIGITVPVVVISILGAIFYVFKAKQACFKGSREDEVPLE